MFKKQLLELFKGAAIKKSIGSIFSSRPLSLNLKVLGKNYFVSVHLLTYLINQVLVMFKKIILPCITSSLSCLDSIHFDYKFKYDIIKRLKLNNQNTKIFSQINPPQRMCQSATKYGLKRETLQRGI